MSKAATMAQVEELHALLTEFLIKELRKDDPDPKLVNQAIGFVHKMGVEPAKDVDNSALNELTRAVEDIENNPELMAAIRPN